MSANRGSRASGFTLVEAAIALSVMSLGLMAALAIVERGTLQSEASTALFLAEDRARGALSGCFDLLAESSIETVDTMMRVNAVGNLNDLFSDRFTIPGVTLAQCTSPTCAFHTRADLSVRSRHFDCAFECCGGAVGPSVTRGKVVPAALGTCPFDGSGLSAPARLDGVKFFVARDVTGAFTALASGRPLWSGLVLLFPAASADGLTELRRYDVYVSDLLAAPPAYSAGYSRFDPTNPSMTDLFDFGTDGTLDGVPDGSVPLTNGQSDALTESFTTALDQGDPVILVTKAIGVAPGPLGVGGIYPLRVLTLRIDLETGQTDFTVAHWESATVYWTASRTFTRTPRTLVRGMTEFAVSTAVSNPFDAATNPGGVGEPNVVRVAIGTSRSPRAQTAQWLHHTEEFQVSARN
jgi:hypothetical protein